MHANYQYNINIAPEYYLVSLYKKNTLFAVFNHIPKDEICHSKFYCRHISNSAVTNRACWSKHLFLIRPKIIMFILAHWYIQDHNYYVNMSID